MVDAYFWRAHDQKEINYIEETGGRLFGFESNWKSELRPAAWREFLRAYPKAELTTITPENIDEFLW